MKRLVVLITLLLLAGCVPVMEDNKDVQLTPIGDSHYVGGGNSVIVYHDVQRGVTCYVLIGGYRGGISCLPDRELGGR